MANFFSDNKDLQFHLGHPMMRKIVELKERGFAEKECSLAAAFVLTSLTAAASAATARPRGSR